MRKEVIRNGRIHGPEQPVPIYENLVWDLKFPNITFKNKTRKVKFILIIILFYPVYFKSL